MNSRSLVTLGFGALGYGRFRMAWAVALLSMTLGCETNADLPETFPGATVTDDANREHGRVVEGGRVISLIPSATEIVAAIGGVDLLVARTEYDELPELADLPSLGAGLTPNLEAVATFAPDLVIAWSDEGDRLLGQRLIELGIPVYSAETQSLADIRRHTENLGFILGLESEADSLLADIDQRLDAVQAEWVGKDSASVFYVVWNDPPQTTGAGTYLNSVISFAGGRNVFGEMEINWPNVSLEEVVRRNPDVIIVTGSHNGAVAEASWLQDRPGWKSLKAVREGRVVIVDANLFNRPGPRVAEAVEYLAGELRNIMDRMPTQNRAP